MTCKTHPDAPHGFVRGASHSEDRYVCECEFWEEPKMNERIRELAEQAGWDNHHSKFDTRIEKFAELIVRECATIINDIPSSPQGSWSDGYYEGCRDSAKQIKRDFGIEE